MKYIKAGSYDLFVSTSGKTVKFYCMDMDYDGGIETSLVIHKQNGNYIFIYDRKSYNIEFIVEESEHHKYHGIPNDFYITHLLKVAKTYVKGF